MVPQFNTFAEFVSMGGNGGFVFGAWGLSIAVIAVLIGRAIVSGRRQKTRVAALEKDLGS
jgi:heme exporter protein CcmD